MLPRTAGLLESFRKLPPLRYARAEMWVSILSDPAINKTFQTLLGLVDESRKHDNAVREITKLIIERGYATLFGGGPMLGAPFDHFADMLRGTRGIALDMFRQPGKLKEAMECWLNIQLASVKNYPMTGCPICVMPLHKGDDTFMSDKQFEEFYWPTLRRVFLAMIDEGLVPMPFAEGKYTNRLKSITDTPKSGIIWWFDQTDMAEAKKTIGDISCILGNVPTSVVMTGTTEQVKESCRKVIETCAPGGGYILGGGAAIDNGKFENLKAMMEAAYEYGTY
jgi:uroporphyrinogen-III decarboxylase